MIGSRGQARSSRHDLQAIGWRRFRGLRDGGYGHGLCWRIAGPRPTLADFCDLAISRRSDVLYPFRIANEALLFASFHFGEVVEQLLDQRVVAFPGCFAIKRDQRIVKT